jgi:hypothetical protein
LLALLCCAVLGCGCAGLKAYPGPRRNGAELAVICAGRELHRNVYLERVDDVALGLIHDHAVVLPGRHAVVATVVLLGRGGSVAATHALELDARAGRVYTVHGDWGTWGPRIWIGDGRSDQPVAEAEAPPRAGLR